MRISLELESRAPFTLRFSANRYGLPADGGKLAAARPVDAIPSRDGDGVVLLNSLSIPARL